MKGDTEVVFAIIFALLGITMGVMFGAGSIKPFLDAFATPLATLVAAFGGSWYAFKLHEDRLQEQKGHSQAETINKTIFELSRQYNMLAEIKRRFLDCHKEDKYRQFLVKPYSTEYWNRPHIDYDNLAFLLCSEEPNVLTHLSKVEQLIAQTLELIQRRSDLHIQRLQPVVEELEKEEGPDLDPNVIEEALGPRDARVLKLQTDRVYDGVDRSLMSIENVIKIIREEAKRIHPNRVILRFHPL